MHTVHFKSVLFGSLPQVHMYSNTVRDAITTVPALGLPAGYASPVKHALGIDASVSQSTSISPSHAAVVLH